jgi:Domain of unknown function (DUF4412)
MNIPKFAFAAACGLSMWAAVPALAEDLTIIYKATDGVSGPSARYLSSMRTREDHGPHNLSMGKVVGPFSNIVDMVLGKYITIDHQKKEYYEDTPQELQASTRLAKQQLEKTTADLKEMYAKTGRKPPPLPSDTRQSTSLEKLPDHRMIAGYECEHYVITLTHSLDDKVVSVATYNYWIAPDLRDPSQTASDSFASQIKGSESEYIRVAREMEDKGFPLAWAMTAPGLERSSEAIDVKIGPVDSSIFLVPAGYTKVKSPATSRIQKDGTAGSN